MDAILHILGNVHVQDRLPDPSTYSKDWYEVPVVINTGDIITCSSEITPLDKVVIIRRTYLKKRVRIFTDDIHYEGYYWDRQFKE